MPLHPPSLPAPLEHAGQGAAELQADALILRAAARTDLFHPPDGSSRTTNAVRLLLPPQPGDVQLVAHVRAELRSLFDAGALLVWRDAEQWAKLALERDPAGRATLVSVVTQGRSDDANGWALPAAETWLRISRIGPAVAFHASPDGRQWALLRHFPFGERGPLRYGLLAQSPTGDGCTAWFTGLTWRRHSLTEVRLGT